MPDEDSQTDDAKDNEAAETPAKAEQPVAPDEPAAEAPNEKQPAEEEEDTRPRPPAGGIADLLAEALPDVKLEAYQGMTDVIVEIERDDVLNVMTVAKEDPRLDLKFLRCLFGVDLEADGLEVVYQLLSLDKGHDVVIKTRLPSDDAHVASVTAVWKAANWHERETRDMFGITFDDHPNLVPLLLPEDMTDHFPLRKDNPLADIEEWQGDELPEEGYGGSKKR
jgi:NADH-quinone oxidoreductase subunit C